MKYALAVLLIMIAASTDTMPAFGSKARVQTRNILDDYLWKNRPLLLFAPSSDEPFYQKIKNMLELEQLQIQDRDMVIIEAFASGVVQINNEAVKDANAGELRRRFAVTDEAFTAVLIGKDGGVKLRQTGRLDLNRIFALIDSMPMRRQEMRQKAQ
jgi:hypothetical protein